MANEELQAQSRAVRDLTKEGLDIAPVDNSFPALTQGELTAAVSGKTVIDNSNNIVLNFRKSGAGAPLPYMGEINGTIVYFDNKGVSRDGTIKLSLASTNIDNKGTQGEGQTRTEDEAEFVMNSLNYKEQVALRVLAAIIKHESNPLGYDDSKIKLLVSQSFRIAVEFQNRAIMFRQEEEGGGGGDSEVDINPESLNSNTEKILYNINESLKNGVVVKGETPAVGKTLYPVMTKVTEVAEVKKVTEVTEVKKVTIDGTPNVSVSNTPHVVVDSMPSDLATTSDVSSAESTIIAAMPHCNYTPPSE